MHLLLDLSHPAYANSLHPFIREMQSRGHSFLIFARDKDLTHQLLREWNIPFTSKGKGATSLAGKLFDTFLVTRKMLAAARKFQPDILLSFSSYQLAVVGRLLGKPVLTLEDTENVSLLHAINRRLSTFMITPECYEGDFGKKHLRFNSYKELGSLLPSRFNLQTIQRPEKPRILLRFVAWKAWHDRGHTGIPLPMKEKIIRTLSHYGQVFISSESPLPPQWEHLRIPLPPEASLSPPQDQPSLAGNTTPLQEISSNPEDPTQKAPGTIPSSPSQFHPFLASCSLVLGESASVAAEAAILGIPSLYIDNTGRGYTRELEHKYHLLLNFPENTTGAENALTRAIQLLSDPTTYPTWQSRQKKMLQEKMDFTKYLVDFVESL